MSERQKMCVCVYRHRKRYMNRVRHTEIDKVRKREREEKRKETKKHSFIRMNNSSF